MMAGRILRPIIFATIFFVIVSAAGGLAFANALAGGASEFIRELGNRAIATSKTPSMSLDER